MRGSSKGELRPFYRGLASKMVLYPKGMIVFIMAPSLSPKWPGSRCLGNFRLLKPKFASSFLPFDSSTAPPPSKGGALCIVSVASLLLSCFVLSFSGVTGTHGFDSSSL